MNENQKLFKDWYFKARKPIGFSFKDLGAIREGLDTIEYLGFLSTFRPEQLKKMKTAYLKKHSRKE